MPESISRVQKLILRWSPLVGRPFEFITSLSPEECARRLKWKEVRQHSWLRIHHTLKVGIWQQDDKIHYRLHRSPTPNLTAEVSGLLERLPDGTTRVTGSAQIRSTHGWLMIILFVPVLFYIPFVLPLAKTLLLYVFFDTLLALLSVACICVGVRLSRRLPETFQV